MSLGLLEPLCRERGITLAIENNRKNFDTLQRLCSEYDPAFLGVCYDSGHGNLVDDGLDQAEALKDRIISVHLHDNDGVKDQHRLLFSGTVDWERLARILASSAYERPVSMEVSMRNAETNEEAVFLAEAFETGTRLTRMVRQCG